MRRSQPCPTDLTLHADSRLFGASARCDGLLRIHSVFSHHLADSHRAGGTKRRRGGGRVRRAASPVYATCSRTPLPPPPPQPRAREPSQRAGRREVTSVRLDRDTHSSACSKKTPSHSRLLPWYYQRNGHQGATFGTLGDLRQLGRWGVGLNSLPFPIPGPHRMGPRGGAAPLRLRPPKPVDPRQSNARKGRNTVCILSYDTLSDIVAYPPFYRLVNSVNFPTNEVPSCHATGSPQVSEIDLRPSCGGYLLLIRQGVI